MAPLSSESPAAGEPLQKKRKTAHTVDQQSSPDDSMPRGLTKMFYLLEGDEDPFNVMVAFNQDISSLKGAIKKENEDDLKGVAASRLRLWQIDKPTPEAIKLTQGGMGEYTLLDNTCKISKYWKDGILPEERVHIFVATGRTPVTKSIDTLSLNVLINGTVRAVQIHKDATVESMLTSVIRDLPPTFHITHEAKILTPRKITILVPVPVADAPVDPTCLDSNNWKQMSHKASLKTYFKESVNDGNINVLAIMPEEKAQLGIQNFEKHFPELFRILRLEVAQVGKWNVNDIALNDATIWKKDEHARAPRFLQDMQTALGVQRIYNPDLEDNSEVDHSKTLGDVFKEVFIVAGSAGGEAPSCTVKSRDELWAFSNVMRGFIEYAPKIISDKSSAIKAAACSVYFTMPPFLSFQDEYNKLKYKQDLPWGHPVLIKGVNSNVSSKYTPKSDISFVSERSFCQYLLVEVVSLADETDRHRLLCQAIAAVRLGHYLRADEATKPFVLLAVYVTSDMVAERYIVAQHGSDYKVHILQKDFNLAKPSQAVHFLRELYNFGKEVVDLEAQIDTEKRDSLAKIKQDISFLPTLTFITRNLTKHVADDEETHPHGPPAGGAQGTEEDIDLVLSPGSIGAPYRDEHVLDFLGDKGIEICIISDDHPHVAHVQRQGSDPIIKFVKKKHAKEIDMLRYFSTLTSAKNHVVRPTDYWTTNLGTFVLMPCVGCWITEYRHLERDFMATVHQLFEGVSFIHEHGIAHLDLKPYNILVDLYTSKLTIIDFGVAERVEVGMKLTGFVGTDGWAAPEVGIEPFDGIRADLWSCGLVVKFVCDAVKKPSHERSFLVEISKRLLDDEAQQRPSMSSLVGWMDLCASLLTTVQSISTPAGQSQLEMESISEIANSLDITPIPLPAHIGVC